MKPEEIIEKVFEGTNYLVRNRAYHSPLPPDLAHWYCYVNGSGHSILCLVEGQFAESEPESQLWQSLCPCPIRGVLRGYRVVKGYPVATGFKYDKELGLIAEPGDDEF